MEHLMDQGVTHLMSSTTLDTLRSGQRAVIRGIDCPNRELRMKLLSMGVVEGTAVKIVGIAPFGCPLSVQLFGCQVALRRSEAKLIEVEL